MHIGRWYFIVDIEPRQPRKLGFYVCTGCRWYWEKQGRNRWFGPRWPVDSQGGTGYPRVQTWAHVADNYGDCARHLEHRTGPPRDTPIGP